MYTKHARSSVNSVLVFQLKFQFQLTVTWSTYQLFGKAKSPLQVGATRRECKPGGIVQTRVYTITGLTASKPGYPGLIMPIRRAAGSYRRPTVSGHFNHLSVLSEADSRAVDCQLRNKLKQHELYEHMTPCTLHKNCNCPFSFMPNSPTIIVPK